MASIFLFLTIPTNERSTLGGIVPAVFMNFINVEIIMDVTRKVREAILRNDATVDVTHELDKLNRLFI